jgi:hypothetical protein
MTAKLSPEQVRELEQAGDRPMPVEDPHTKRVYLLVDAEQYDVIRRSPTLRSEAELWTEKKNERRCELIRKKFSQGISAQEAGELAELQDELAAYRKRTVPLPYDAVDALQAALNSTPRSP